MGWRLTNPKTALSLTGKRGSKPKASSFFIIFYLGVKGGQSLRLHYYSRGEEGQTLKPMVIVLLTRLHPKLHSDPETEPE